MSAFAERLAAVKKARLEARVDNRSHAAAEAERATITPKAEAAMRRAQEAEQKGSVSPRTKMLQQSAIDADRVHRAAEKVRRRADKGFSTYEEATARQHARLTAALVPVARDKYNKQRDKLGEAFYGSAGTPLPAVQDTPAAIDRMVQDLESQIAKRQKYSRRRTHNDDADIDYINERNAKFNKKLERFYGEHTAEIKQNLERGTAI